MKAETKAAQEYGALFRTPNGWILYDAPKYFYRRCMISATGEDGTWRDACPLEAMIISELLDEIRYLKMPHKYPNGFVILWRQFRCLCGI